MQSKKKKKKEQFLNLLLRLLPSLSHVGSLELFCCPAVGIRIYSVGNGDGSLSLCLSLLMLRASWSGLQMRKCGSETAWSRSLEAEKASALEQGEWAEGEGLFYEKAGTMKRGLWYPIMCRGNAHGCLAVPRRSAKPHLTCSQDTCELSTISSLTNHRPLRRLPRHPEFYPRQPQIPMISNRSWTSQCSPETPTSMRVWVTEKVLWPQYSSQRGNDIWGFTLQGGSCLPTSLNLPLNKGVWRLSSQNDCNHFKWLQVCNPKW